MEEENWDKDVDRGEQSASELITLFHGMSFSNSQKLLTGSGAACIQISASASNAQASPASGAADHEWVTLISQVRIALSRFNNRDLLS